MSTVSKVESVDILILIYIIVIVSLGAYFTKESLVAKHILSARQFTCQEVSSIFEIARYMQNHISSSYRPLSGCQGGFINLFYQRSTRTHSTFEIAARILGLMVLYSTQAADEFSSAAKGESLEDTIRLFAGFPIVRIIALRHPHEGSAQVAAEIADHFGRLFPLQPIIDAGVTA